MIDEAKLALQALESVLDGMTEKAVQYKKVSEAIPALRAAIEAAERAGPGYWQEEARRYAENADYWRGKYEAAIEHPPAITDEMVERATIALEKCDSDSLYVLARAALEAALGVKHAE